MPPSLRKVVAAAIGGGAIAIASVLITGPSGNDGLEGVSYIPYKDIVGVWTVCHGHNGKYTAQDATTAQKGIIQLSSATNSTSETLAATPKAVKSAYDNAEKRLQKDQNGADIPDKGRFLNNINAVSKTDFADKRGMRYVRVNAPAGATSGKYYPVVVMRSAGSVSELASRVIITTATRTAGDPMNNCEFNGFVMPGGWTDRGVMLMECSGNIKTMNEPSTQ